MKKPILLGCIIREGDIGPFCPICKSSFVTKFLFFRTQKCIHPECPNTGRKENEKEEKE
jgi:hypothetical protein